MKPRWSCSTTLPSWGLPVVNDHPRYGEWLRYKKALAKQLVNAALFERWFDETVRDEEGFDTIYCVTSSIAQLEGGWYHDIYGPQHVLIARFGPYTNRLDAEDCK